MCVRVWAKARTASGPQIKKGDRSTTPDSLVKDEMLTKTTGCAPAEVFNSTFSSANRFKLCDNSIETIYDAPQGPIAFAHVSLANNSDSCAVRVFFDLDAWDDGHGIVIERCIPAATVQNLSPGLTAFQYAVARLRRIRVQCVGCPPAAATTTDPFCSLALDVDSYDANVLTAGVPLVPAPCADRCPPQLLQTQVQDIRISRRIDCCVDRVFEAFNTVPRGANVAVSNLGSCPLKITFVILRQRSRKHGVLKRIRRCVPAPADGTSTGNAPRSIFLVRDLIAIHAECVPCVVLGSNASCRYVIRLVLTSCVNCREPCLLS